MKTYDQWQESGKNLSQFLAPGDVVDEAFVNWAVAVMPPRTMTSQLVQIGEPCNHVEGKPTWTTFHKKPVDGVIQWVHCGDCYRHEVEPPEGVVRSFGEV